MKLQVVSSVLTAVGIYAKLAKEKGGLKMMLACNANCAKRLKRVSSLKVLLLKQFLQGHTALDQSCQSTSTSYHLACVCVFH